MFDCQVQRLYYDYYGVEYEYVNIIGDSLDTYMFTKSEVNYNKTDYSKLIAILNNDKINKIGEANGSLSSTWYKRNEDNKIINIIKNNVGNYFKNIAKTQSKQNMWTTFVKYKELIKGKGYTKGFVPCNARAVNDYRKCTALAYTINRYFDPRLKNFFANANIRVEEDQYALSELIQWLFRSALRDGKPIQLYIPSKRMRELLVNWISEPR